MNKAINKVFSLNSMLAFSSYTFLKSCKIFFDNFWAMLPLTQWENGFFKNSLRFKLLYLKNTMSKPRVVGGSGVGYSHIKAVRV